MSSRRAVRTFIKLSLLVLGLTIGVVLAETALRLSIPDSRIDLFRHTTETERYKVMKSNYEGIAFGVPLRTNELGFRDANFGPVAKKGPGEFRVVVLGDSFTVCAGVPFADLASTRLRAVNLGTAGYSPIEYALVLDEVALALEPDCVLVALYVPNDFEIKTRANNREIALGRRTVQQPGWVESLYLHQALGATVESLWSRVVPRRAPAATPPPAAPAVDEGWEENTKALLRIAARTREKGIALHVCLLPHPSNFAKQTARHEKVAQFCRQHGIAVTDVLPRFIASGVSPRAFRLNAIDSHPNAAYNAIVAEAMAEAVASVESR